MSIHPSIHPSDHCPLISSWSLQEYKLLWYDLKLWKTRFKLNNVLEIASYTKKHLKGRFYEIFEHKFLHLIAPLCQAQAECRMWPISYFLSRYLANIIMIFDDKLVSFNDSGESTFRWQWHHWVILHTHDDETIVINDLPLSRAPLWGKEKSKRHYKVAKKKLNPKITSIENLR